VQRGLFLIPHDQFGVQVDDGNLLFVLIPAI